MKSIRTAPFVVASLLFLWTSMALATTDAAFQLNKEGISLMKAGKYAQAKEKFLAAVEEDSVYAEARVNAAKAAEMEDPPDWVTVKTQYLTVIQFIDAENMGALLGIGEYYVKVSNMPDAEASFRKVLELDPQSGAARFGLGNMYHKMKKYDKAAVEYKKALAKDPNAYSRGYLRLGIYEFEKNATSKKFGKATEYLEKYLESGDREKEGLYYAHSYLGQILVHTGKPQAALTHLQKAKEIDPKAFENYYFIAEVYSQMNKWKEAETEYLACLKQNPGYGEAHFKLAVMYQQQYRDAEAIEHYKAAAKDPSFRNRNTARSMAQQLEEYLKKVEAAEAEEQGL